VAASDQRVGRMYGSRSGTGSVCVSVHHGAKEAQKRMKLTSPTVCKDQLGRSRNVLDGVVERNAIGVDAGGEGNAQAQAQEGADGGVCRDGGCCAPEARAVFRREVVLEVLLADLGEVFVGIAAEDCKHGEFLLLVTFN